MSIRITELDAITSLQDGDYVAIDNESNGTHKFKVLDISSNVANNIANNYSSNASYAIGQYCLYNNNLYRCTTTISTPEAWNASHWVQVTVGEGLYDKVDKINGKELSTNDFTNAYKTKLDGIEDGAEVNVQANWTENDSSKDDYIKNKPENATTSTSGFMSASDKQKLDNIEAGAEVNVQPNWAENDSSKDDYIKNKPTIDTALSTSSDNAVRNSAITAGINTVQNNLNAEITARENAVSAEQTDRENADNALDGRIDTIEEILPNKANINGSYEEMTVGSADNLSTDIRTNDQTPYLFRTSGGSVDIGNREYINSIVGGTIAWNQLVEKPADTASRTSDGITWQWSDGICNVSGAYTGSSYQEVWSKPNAVTVQTGHVYLFTFYNNASTNVLKVVLGGGKVPYTEAGCPQQATIKKATANGAVNVYYRATSTSDFSMKINCLQVFDLTQMFGSTIADYIYSLEQATAGAGVAWFKKLFPKSYYEYNAGELMSVKALRHITRGFNAWDEETADGYWDVSTGVFAESGNWVASKNYIPILPNTTYYIKGDDSSSYVFGCWCFYDADKNFIEGSNASHKNVTFTTPSNAHYMTFYCNKNYKGTNICINLSWDGSRNGEYEAYVKHSYPLDDSLTLMGIPKLDSGNNLYYDGDTYASDGTVTRRYGVVDLGSLNWEYASSLDLFYTTGITIKSNTAMICSKYPYVSGYSNLVDKSIANVYNTRPAIRDSSYSDAQSLKASLNGVKLVYELPTPTTESAEPYTNPQIVDDFGTEEYVIDSTIDVPIPVGHDTDYPINLKSKLEMAPDSPDGDGDYIVRQTNGTNEYVPLIIEDQLPAVPSTDGTYTLTVTIANGEATYSWT